MEYHGCKVRIFYMKWYYINSKQYVRQNKHQVMLILWSRSQVEGLQCRTEPFGHNYPSPNTHHERNHGTLPTRHCVLWKQWDGALGNIPALHSSEQRQHLSASPRGAVETEPLRPFQPCNAKAVALSSEHCEGCPVGPPSTMPDLH